jgi:hypothetical protein
VALTRDAALALLTLAELPQVGERRLQRLQERARRRHIPLARLADLPPSALRDEFALPVSAVERLCAARAWHEARCAGLAAHLFRHEVHVCPLGDPPYPPGWARHGDPPPPLAYLHGDPALLRQPIAALLHSRTVDAGTVSATARLARAAVGAGFALAVGGMKTTHRIAAVTARALGAPRLVVLDRGLLAAFGGDLARDPFGFGPGRAPFDRSRTLVATPFRCEDHAVPRSGRRRDALLAALADVVVAVQARPDGEIEQLCLRALARGQPVVVWRAHNPRLVAAGAVPLAEAGLEASLARLRVARVRPASARRR